MNVTKGVILVILIITILSGCNSDEISGANSGSQLVPAQLVPAHSQSSLEKEGYLLNADDFSELRLTSGKLPPWDEFSQSVVVLNYWAVWCAPCRQEIPVLNQLHEEGLVKVLGIDFDQQEGQALTSAIVTMGIKFPVLVSAGAASLNLEWPEVLPTTLIIADARVAEILRGPQTQQSVVEAVNKVR